jgi:hypothetical protein
MLAEALAAQNIQERSRLISLPPIGIGTPLVESLPSYLHRLADKHWVKLYRMTGHLLPQLKRRFTSGGVLRSNWSNNQTALATAFSSFTKRDDLHELTLARLSAVVSPSGLFRSHRAWCPACLKAMGSQPYQPALWNLNSITCCSVHRRKLQQKCPKCNTDIRVWGEACLSATCPNCEANLTGCPVEMASTWELWKPHQCSQVLENPAISAPTRRLAQITEQLFYRTFSTKFAAVKAAGIGTAFAYQAGTLSTTTSLEHLLRIAYSCSVSLADLLTGDLVKLKPKPRVLPISLVAQRPRYSIKELEKKCYQLLKANGPMTARQVCLNLRISPLLLRKKCPALYRELKIAHK